jgi:catechol 2,3-dioxygenase-like lactoylglutathione lyase family enzyme
MIESVSAVTLATHNMPRAVAFYRMLGFEIVHGGDDAAVTSFRAGTTYLNLVAQPVERLGLGRDVSSSTIPRSTPAMRARSRPATEQTRHRAMPNGANSSFT